MVQAPLSLGWLAIPGRMAGWLGTVGPCPCDAQQERVSSVRTVSGSAVRMSGQPSSPIAGLAVALGLREESMHASCA